MGKIANTVESKGYFWVNPIGDTIDIIEPIWMQKENFGGQCNMFSLLLLRSSFRMSQCQTAPYMLKTGKLKMARRRTCPMKLGAKRFNHRGKAGISYPEALERSQCKIIRTILERLYAEFHPVKACSYTIPNTVASRILPCNMLPTMSLAKKID